MVETVETITLNSLAENFINGTVATRSFPHALKEASTFGAHPLRFRGQKVVLVGAEAECFIYSFWLSLPTLWVSSIGSSTFRGGLRSGQGEDLEQVLAQLREPLDDSVLFTPVEDSQATHHSIPSPQSVAGHLKFEEFPAHYSPLTPYPSPTRTPVHSPRSPTLPSLLFDDLNPLQFTMADITPLPACGERNAPKFDPDYKEQLPTFFDEFQDVASKAGIISDHPTMKKECLRYVNTETIRFWRSLATFKDDTKTWSEFKTEVLSNYPDAMQSAEVTMDELKKVVEDHSKTGIMSVKSLAKYHRSFSTVASSLMDQGVLSAVQAAHLLGLCRYDSPDGSPSRRDGSRRAGMD
ncbi:hypothetical protein PM082_006852 [Marasmius tenuissimus]|nr:hypothetical protein PM082_006852 [Marasmius tenuissimus]